MKIQRWSIVTFAFLLLIMNASCSKYSYDRIEVPGWFAIDYPKGFEYTIDPNSTGFTPILNVIQSFSATLPDSNGNPVTSVILTKISVYGVDGKYSDIVDYDNTMASLTKDKLVTKGKTKSVFKWSSDDPTLGNNIYIVRDMGNSWSCVVWGNTNNATKLAMDTLTHYCTDMANSIFVFSSWEGGGGGP